MYPKSILLCAFATSVWAAPGDGDWGPAYTKAKAALAKLSNTEKAALASGIGWEKGPCVGNTVPISSIGYPQFCAQDAPLGIRFAKSVTAFPAGITVGSTWDRDLLYQRGYAIGEEAKALGIHVQLGPVAGALGKIPAAGRNWEGFSNDPYLAGIATAVTVKGQQDAGVQACAKHYLANEQERNRETMSSNIDDRTNHELYLWPFADAVKANVASVMCSYNKFNTTWACESKSLLTSLLKDELDFQGYVMSDWNAQHTTSGSANAGLDMTMPGDGMGNGVFLWGQNLVNAVSSGQVPQSRLDDMATRILAAWYFLGQDGGYPSIGFNSWGNSNGGPNVQGDHKNIARAVARDGIVLLKNVDNALPLKKPSSLAVIGLGAIADPNGINSCSDKGCLRGTLTMGWGSGTANLPYLSAPLDAIRTKAQSDGTTLTTSTSDSTSQGASAASAASTAIVFIAANSGEGYITVEGNAGDRINLDPWHNGNDLVKAVAAVNKKTIVVVHSVGPIILETIVALPNVVAIVWANLPGQEAGNALVDILYGSTNPGGKLPYTIGKQQSDYGTSIANGDDNFAEGLNIDYRRFDSLSIAPRYEFGFGLSYTTFDYSGLTLSSISSSPGSSTPAPGGASNLWDIVATVSVTVTNTGSVSGAEVAQLYIGLPASAPASPPKQLRGFDKLPLAAGASGIATFQLRRKDLSYWNVGQQKWILPTGSFNIYVGSSSRDIRLTGTISSSGSTISSIGVSSSTSASRSSTTLVTSSRTTTAVISTNSPVITTTSRQQTTIPSTTRSQTTTARTTGSSGGGAGSPLWGQCGGLQWTGPTTCSQGTCTFSNPYYSQCLP